MIIAFITATPMGYRLQHNAAFQKRDHNMVVNGDDVQVWGKAVQHAAECSPEFIGWSGFYALDAAIREYLAAGGELP